MSDDSKKTKPTCPICEKEVEPLSENRFFPFCSRRCKMEDLGKWLDEDYRISMTPDSTEREVPDEQEREEE